MRNETQHLRASLVCWVSFLDPAYRFKINGLVLDSLLVRAGKPLLDLPHLFEGGAGLGERQGFLIEVAEVVEGLGEASPVDRWTLAGELFMDVPCLFSYDHQPAGWAKRSLATSPCRLG